MQTSLLQVAPQAFILTTYGTTGDDKINIMTTHGRQWS